MLIAQFLLGLVLIVLSLAVLTLLVGLVCCCTPFAGCPSSAAATGTPAGTRAT